jgi:hypothetical protein
MDADAGGWWRPAWVGTVTSIFVRSARRTSCRAAADRCDRTAPGPPANTAAMKWPLRLSNDLGTSE